MKAMEVMIPVCCGIDIHRDTAVCCLRRRDKQEVRTYSTITGDLRKLKQWLVKSKCTHVAIESTGVFWKPVFNILEDRLEVVLVNARHVKHVPGRKTDVKDCEWLAKLLQCGLIRGSFIPPRWVRELRDLTRYRKQVKQQMSSEQNRIQKILQDANIKLSSVATNVFGVSGTNILKALLSGETDSEELARLAVGKLRSKSQDLERALEGNVTGHHLFMIRTFLDHIEYLQKTIQCLEAEILQKLEPYREDFERLRSIPGVGETGAASLIAEMGLDMSVFPDETHLSSWTGICPGNNESAGKKKAERPDMEMRG
jgi:transposase